MHLSKFSYLFVSETSQVGLVWSEFIGLEKKKDQTAVEGWSKKFGKGWYVVKKVTTNYCLIYNLMAAYYECLMTDCL